jgi:hypothetical protein
MLKFPLLPLGLDIIPKSGTVQEYRKIWQAIGKARNSRAMKEVDYWGLIWKLIEEKIKTPPPGMEAWIREICMWTPWPVEPRRWRGRS